MPAGFTFIEQYRTLAKDLEQQSCNDMLNFDQEVPDADIKPEIRYEAASEADILSIMTGVNTSSGVTETAVCQSYPNFFGSSNNQKNTFLDGADIQNKFITAPTAAASTLSLFSSPSSSPWMSSTTLPSLSPFSSSASPLSSSPIFTSTKTSTYITELGTSGCTVVSNIDFLQDTSSTMPPFGPQDDSRDLIDLDKQSVSMYEDYEPFSIISKHGSLSDEPSGIPLEEVFIMTDIIQNECDNLKIPYDPLLWTSEHVRTWVSWVCQKNSVQDVSGHLQNIDGQNLCSISSDALAKTFGDSGVKLTNELELLKAAKGCFSNQASYADFDVLASSQDSYLDSSSFLPSASPAPSTCSSTHDSNTSTLSTHSDHSDDESSGYGSQLSSYSTSSKREDSRISHKIPNGRGHKQTIHLWQFLKELLLSKENNFSDCIRWLDRKAGVFKIEDSKKVASLWGARKNRPAMNYDKLSRSVRQYYKKGIIKKTEQSKRLVYQFCAGYM